MHRQERERTIKLYSKVTNTVIIVIDNKCVLLSLFPLLCFFPQRHGDDEATFSGMMLPSKRRMKELPVRIHCLSSDRSLELVTPTLL